MFGIAKWSSEVTIKELCVKWDPIQWMTIDHMQGKQAREVPTSLSEHQRPWDG